jgi:hypothetical protein
MRLGDLVCKAIAEAQSGGMHAFAPALVGLRDPSRRGGRHCHDVESESIDQIFHFLSDISAGSHDDGFGHRPDRNQDVGLGLESLDAGVGASASPRMIAMSAEVSTTINGANPRRHKESPGSVRPAAPQLP